MHNTLLRGGSGTLTLSLSSVATRCNTATHTPCVLVKQVRTLSDTESGAQNRAEEIPPCSAVVIRFAPSIRAQTTTTTTTTSDGCELPCAIVRWSGDVLIVCSVAVSRHFITAPSPLLGLQKQAICLILADGARYVSEISRRYFDRPMRGSVSLFYGKKLSFKVYSNVQSHIGER